MLARGRGHGGADEPRRPGHQHGRRGLERAHSGFRARLRGGGGEDSGLQSRPGGRRRHPWGDGRRNTDRVDGISNTVHPLGHWWPFDRGCTASDCHSILQDRWAHRLLPRSAAVLLGNARSSEPPMSRTSRVARRVKSLVAARITSDGSESFVGRCDAYLAGHERWIRTAAPLPARSWAF